jgi:hypothetical protein
LTLPYRGVSYNLSTKKQKPQGLPAVFATKKRRGNENEKV